MAGIALSALTLVGCKKNQQTQNPEATTVIQATPDQQTAYGVQQAYVEPTEDVPETVGSETLSTGEEVAVVYYVHTYPEAVETYPRVWWAGRWFYNVDGEFFASSSQCPHQGGPLGDGLVDGKTGTCPWHAWQFDLVTGEAVFDPGFKIDCFNVELRGDDILIEV